MSKGSLTPEAFAGGQPHPCVTRFLFPGRAQLSSPGAWIRHWKLSGPLFGLFCVFIEGHGWELSSPCGQPL